MACRQICIQLKPKTGNFIREGRGMYVAGVRFCSMCDDYIKWDGSRCPCCGMPIRSCPRASKYKKKFKKLVYY